MNKKSQAGPVGFVFCMLFFFLFIAFAGGTIWSLFGMASSQGGLSGIEAFVLDHFSIIVFLSAILSMIGYSVFGGR